MTARTHLALCTLVFLALMLISFFQSVINGVPGGMAFWSFLILTNVYGAAFHVVSAITDTRQAGR
jgi:hypothetical protein